MLLDDGDSSNTAVPIGARIIRVIRAYDSLTCGLIDDRKLSPHEALQELRGDVAASFDESVLNALAQVLQRHRNRSTVRVPATI